MSSERRGEGVVTVMGTVALDTVGRVTRLPDADGAGRLQDLRHTFGGTAGNVAMALARLGAGPRLLAAVGGDFAGSGYEAALQDAGADVSDVRHAAGPTAHAYLFTDADGRQHIYFYPGTSTDLGDVPVRRERLAHFAAGEFPHYAPHMEAAEEATLDPGQELFHRNFADVKPVLPLADVVFLNQHERARLETLGWPVARLLDEGVRLVVETRGGEEQVLHEPGRRERLPVAPARVVELTGAGDAHRAGFLYARLHDAEAADACRIGAVMAACAIEGDGPQTNLPDEAALRKRYEDTFGSWPL